MLGNSVADSKVFSELASVFLRGVDVCSSVVTSD
jgi:hypothetical protein